MSRRINSKNRMYIYEFVNELQHVVFFVLRKRHECKEK